MVHGKKVIGIIAEYNPFHQGHRYMLHKIRTEFQADYIAVVMSGDFVQRGEPAIFDKYARAEAALRNGADLIVQLPVMFSAAGAEDFAAGAVCVLRSLGFVDQLVFGSESGDLDRLQKLAGLELSEGSAAHAKLNAVLRDALSRGMSYPKAREQAMRTVLTGEDEAGFSSLRTEAASPAASFSLKSNDILGIEYLKAMKRQNACFSAACIRRDLRMRSAHAIRESILEEAGRRRNGAAAPAETEHADNPCRPPDTGSYCPDGMCMPSPSGLADLDEASKMLSYRLLQLICLEEEAGAAPLLSEYLDVSRELSDAIRRGAREPWSFRERIREIKTRNYTYSRISRALLHILLGIRKKEYAALREQYFGKKEMLPYVRILGVRADARCLLSESAAAVVTSPADCKKRLQQLQRERVPETPEAVFKKMRTEPAAGMFRTDLYAADLYRQIWKPFDPEHPLPDELQRFFLVV